MGGQKSESPDKIKVSATIPPEALREKLSLASSRFQGLPAFLDLRPHHSNERLPPGSLCLLFCLCRISPCLSLKRSLVMSFGAYRDNQGQPPHLKITSTQRSPLKTTCTGDRVGTQCLKRPPFGPVHQLTVLLLSFSLLFIRGH